MQVQRRRKRVPDIHKSSIDTSMNVREHICVGPEVDERQMLKRLADDEKHIVKEYVSLGPVDDDYDDHDKPVCSPLRSVFPISFDCLYS